MIKMDAK